jgi:hypothetical protein
MSTAHRMAQLTSMDQPECYCDRKDCVSWVDDQAAEFEAAIRNAKARIAYGKHFPARQLAKEIEALRKMLLEEYGTLECALDALQSTEEPSGIITLAQSYARQLLSVVLVSPKALRLVAEAFGRLQDSGVEDPRAMNIIDAYEHCEPWPPTFGELKRTFIARSGVDCWRSADFAVRKTLKSLRLPLAKDKVGRPPEKLRKRRRRSTYPTKRYMVGKLAT